MRALLLTSIALLPWISDCGKKLGSDSTSTAPPAASAAADITPPPAADVKPDLKGEPPLLLKDEKAKRLGDDEDPDVNDSKTK